MDQCFYVRRVQTSVFGPIVRMEFEEGREHNYSLDLTGVEELTLVGDVDHVTLVGDPRSLRLLRLKTDGTLPHYDTDDVLSSGSFRLEVIDHISSYSRYRAISTLLPAFTAECDREIILTLKDHDGTPVIETFRYFADSDVS